MQNTIANALERRNITKLTHSVNLGKTPTMFEEWTWYVDSNIVSADCHEFQLYWIDFKTNERGEVFGETGYEWLELHEVAMAYNDEQNGDFFYVGLSNYDGAVSPNWSELKDSVSFAEQISCKYEERLQEWHTYSTWLAAYILFKTSPTQNLHKRENWV